MKLHIRRTQVPDVMTLVQIVEEHEAILLEMRKNQRSPNAAVANAVTPSSSQIPKYIRQEHYWRCKQRGHRRTECRNARILFCSVCGKDGVYTKDRRGKFSTPKSTDPRRYDTVIVNGQILYGLIDTGAVSSFAHPRIADWCIANG